MFAIRVLDMAQASLSGMLPLRWAISCNSCKQKVREGRKNSRHLLSVKGELDYKLISHGLACLLTLQKFLTRSSSVLADE